jgi:hypothetical protein
MCSYGSVTDRSEVHTERRITYNPLPTLLYDKIRLSVKVHTSKFSKHEIAHSNTPEKSMIWGVQPGVEIGGKTFVTKTEL